MTYYLLISAAVLCGLLDSVFSQRGHCAKDHCLVLLQEPEDFAGAQKRCKDNGGELLVVDVEQPQETLRSLLSGFNGSLWVKTPSFTGSTRLETCPGLRMGEDLNMTSQPCGDRLDGFLCRSMLSKTTCSSNPGVAGKLKFRSHWGFDLKYSDPITTGVVAVEEKDGSKFPASEHICFDGKWKKAPWACEVMRGGCEYKCTGANTCVCPEGQRLHPNQFSCATGPCDHCTQGCEKQGDSHVCKCDIGYRLAPDRMTCEDVDECKEQDLCRGEGQECVNTPGKYECRCQHGFFEDAGVCVNSSICMQCEQKCELHNGIYRCTCHDGFKVSVVNATRCEQDCTEKDCKAHCVRNEDIKKPDMDNCRCPDGYIRDTRGNTTFCTDHDECENEKMCDHDCKNSYGSYTCSCREGFTLHDGHLCEKEDDDVEGSTDVIPSPPTPADTIGVPSYVKTGSALGISVFVLLCAVLLFCVVRHLTERCAKINISSLGHSDLDIFHLQQVTTETYKRLSFDKQFKNDLQRQ